VYGRSEGSSPFRRAGSTPAVAEGLALVAWWLLAARKEYRSWRAYTARSPRTPLSLGGSPLAGDDREWIAYEAALLAESCDPRARSRDSMRRLAGRVVVGAVDARGRTIECARAVAGAGLSRRGTPGAVPHARLVFIWRVLPTWCL